VTSLKSTESDWADDLSLCKVCTSLRGHSAWKENVKHIDIFFLWKMQQRLYTTNPNMAFIFVSTANNNLKITGTQHLHMHHLTIIFQLIITRGSCSINFLWGQKPSSCQLWESFAGLHLFFINQYKRQGSATPLYQLFDAINLSADEQHSLISSEIIFTTLPQMGGLVA